MPFIVTKSERKKEEQINENENLNRIHNLHDIDIFIYDDNSIESFRIDEAIN